MAKELNEETRKALAEFQQAQQQLQFITYQLQSLQGRKMELDKALEEVGKGGDKFYKYVGGIIVPRTKEELEAELKKEKEELDSRITLFNSQTEKLQKKSAELRGELEKSMPKQEGEGAQVSE
jgi:prefoldin beta subunit